MNTVRVEYSDIIVFGRQDGLAISLPGTVTLNVPIGQGTYQAVTAYFHLLNCKVSTCAVKVLG